MTITLPPWQPDAGPGDPMPASPPRTPGSVRRTTTIDVPWPDYENVRGPMHVRGRDLLTPDDGAPQELRAVDATFDVDLIAGRLESVDGVDAGRWGALIGATLRSGFARFLGENFIDESTARTLEFSAFDDLPGAFLVSGYSMIRNGMLPEDPDRGPERAAHQADVCVGWATSTPVFVALRDHGRTAIPYGPVAPPLEAHDVDGWHAMPRLEERAVRRQRLIDVRRSVARGGHVEVFSHFRDSYVAEDHHMVMHEYAVRAVVDSSRKIAELEVEPRVLPWAECPGAVASAQALVGAPLGELTARVRADLSGPVGCTHLSSTLRALADVGPLADELH